MKLCLSFILLLSLAACSGIPDRQYQGIVLHDSQRDSKLNQLVIDNPEQRAAHEAAKGNHRLIAIGFHGSEQKPIIVGLECSGKIGKAILEAGCVPPSNEYLKLIMRYNLAMIEQPDFPQNTNCVIDSKWTADITNGNQAEKNAIQK